MWRILEFAELASTNTLAAEMLARGEARHGDVIQARHQHSGRGRVAGRVWNDEPGASLLISAVITKIPGPAHLLQYRAALAVLDALRVVARTNNISEHDFLLKWPNDILLNRKKVCGILLEAQWSASQMRSAIIGIGVNVRQTSFPVELSKIATSLHQCGISVEVDSVRESILDRLGRELDEALSGNALLSRLRSELAWMSRVPALTLVSNDGNAQAQLRYEDLDDTGALLLRQPDGVVITARNGSLTWETLRH